MRSSHFAILANICLQAKKLLKLQKCLFIVSDNYFQSRSNCFGKVKGTTTHKGFAQKLHFMNIFRDSKEYGGILCIVTYLTVVTFGYVCHFCYYPYYLFLNDVPSPLGWNKWTDRIQGSEFSVRIAC